MIAVMLMEVQQNSITDKWRFNNGYSTHFQHHRE